MAEAPRTISELNAQAQEIADAQPIIDAPLDPGSVREDIGYNTYTFDELEAISSRTQNPEPLPPSETSPESEWKLDEQTKQAGREGIAAARAAMKAARAKTGSV
jgi:hypothetical protein